MTRYTVNLLLFKTLLFYVVVREVVTSAIGKPGESYQSLPQITGLYNSSDKVVVLNITNFKKTVYGSEQGWLVEFYNSWCGFCYHYAPIWKSLAEDIYTWRDIVVVAALDCADDDNNPLCRDYEIMGYPDVRYFARRENPSSLGTEVKKGKELNSLRRNLISRLIKEQQEGRGEKWPNITPYRSSEIKNVWDGVPETVKYFFFLFEETDSYLGAEVILDLHNAKSLTLRSVNSENSLLCLMHGITRFPSLVVYSRDGKQNRLSLRVATREGTIKVIDEFMRSQGIDIKTPTIPQHPLPTIHSDPATHGRTKYPEKKWPDLLYQADLESTLRYSLGHEIPMRKLIDGDRMRALKNFTSVLASYFPMKRGNPMFLNTLSFVIRSKDVITGEDFRTLVSSTEQEMFPVYSEKNGWIGCEPSKNGLRGYPCGLWTLFHTLSVNFAEKSIQYPDMEASLVLGAIHGYVKYFFGCADCSGHFLEMAERRKIFGVSSAGESVLWLWKAHNEVNERLAGDSTEDPEHRKIQYPSEQDCAACKDKNGEWNENEVLNYLKNKYSYSRTNSKASTSFAGWETSEVAKSREERLARVDKRLGINKFGWDFTIFDISICVVLYITSAAILVLVCIKFAVKRSRKRKLYVQSILEKF